MSAGGHIVRNRTELRSGKNLNTLIVPGIFALTNPTNSPGAGNYIVVVYQARSADDADIYIQQTVMNVATGVQSVRYNNGASWSAFAALGSGGGSSYDPANVAITGGSITGMSSPSGASDVATKAYVDAITAGIGGTRAAVRVATTAQITIATSLNNGDTLDGVVLATNDLVLVKNQVLTKQNGIYVVGVVPARSTSFDTFAELAGALVVVAEGTVNTGSLWFFTNPSSGVIDTDPIPVNGIQIIGTDLASEPGASNIVITSSTGGNATILAATHTEAGAMSAADKTKLDGIEAAAEANVPANLSMSRNATSVTVASDTGSDATIPAATSDNAGVLTASDKAKIDALTGAGDLSIDLTLGTIDDVSIEIEPSRGASVTLPAANVTQAGLMTATQRNKLAGIAIGAEVNEDTNLSILNRDDVGFDLQSSTGNAVQFDGASHSEAGLMTAADKIKIDNIIADAGDIIVTNETNLSIGTHNNTTLQVLSDTGTGVTLPAATPTAGTNKAGLLTAADKSKLDGLSAGGNDLSLGTVDGNSVDIDISGGGDSVTIPAATGTDAGVMLASDKSKLDGIEASADANVDSNLTVISHTNTGFSIHSSTSSGNIDAAIPLATAAAGTNKAGLISPTEKDKITALGTVATLASDTDTALGANSDLRVATQKATKAYVDAALGANDAMVFKGVIDASGNPNYPAGEAGYTYKISVAGKIGGGSGPNVEIGDTIICSTDGTLAGTHAGVGANWFIIQVNIDGAVTGPASATGDAIALFNSTSGKIIKDSAVTIDTDTALTANSASRVPTQAAVKTYADTKLPTSYLDTDTALAANSDVKIASQKATKSYVDGLISALGSAAAVVARVATTATVTIATALNNGDTLDGVTLVTGDLVLVWKQAAPADNGLYIVGVSPARSTAWNTFNSMAGLLVSVAEGTLYGDMVLQGTADKGGTLNTTALTFQLVAGLVDPSTSLGTSDKKTPTQGAVKSYVDTQVAAVKPTECLIIAVGDETTVITTGTAKVTFRMPYAFTVTEVRASLTTVSSSGLPTVDINEGAGAGTTILSTKLTIDATELTSTTAATPPVISDSSLADDAQITIDIDVAGTGATGLKVYLIGHRT